MRRLSILLISLFLAACTAREYHRIATVSSTQAPKEAVVQIARERAVTYAKNPNVIKSDLKRLENIGEFFSNLHQTVARVWGEKNVKEPEPKQYVKYLNHYKSRALIDYEKGVLRIETVDDKAPKESLKSAIKTALLMPHDPRGEDLFNANDIPPGGEPYLYNEVLDHEGQPVKWEWRAERFASHLVNGASLKTETTEKGDTLSYVQIDLVKKHGDIRAQKYQDIVNQYATKYRLDPKLIYALIKTESNFNRYAISRTGAVGLMQIMPGTAGADAYQELNGKKGQPTREYLFEPKNNIEMGAVYVNILNTRYLKDVANKTSKEYCVISAYNGGSGLVLKTFDRDRARAFGEINRQSPQNVYQILTTKVPAEETRNYLVKVTNNKKLF